MKKVYILQNLCCANCAAKIERAVSKLAGIKSVSVNFITQKMTVESDGAAPADEALEKIVKKYEPKAGLSKV